MDGRLRPYVFNAKGWSGRRESNPYLLAEASDSAIELRPNRARKENWRRVQESNLPDPKVSPR
jgi:hypothetical protein